MQREVEGGENCVSFSPPLFLLPNLAQEEIVWADKGGGGEVGRNCGVSGYATAWHSILSSVLLSASFARVPSPSFLLSIFKPGG